MFTTGLSQAQILASIQGKLLNLRSALNDVEDLYNWSSALSVADLESIGFNASDAAAILSAISDANAMSAIYHTGQPALSYPQPASDYVYAQSQSQVIGPQ